MIAGFCALQAARLLASAAEEFGRAGFQAANIDAISLSAGYSKGTIYNYFASKEELFAAVVGTAARAAMTRSRAPAEAPTRQRLHASLRGFCRWAAENEAFARVLVRECLIATPGLYQRVVDAEGPLIEQLEAILEQGRARGDVRSDVPPHLLALALLGLTDLALANHWASENSDSAIDDIPELVLTLLLGHAAAADAHIHR